MNDELSESYYGWVFTGRDISEESAREFPRDEMLEFRRPVLFGDVILLQTLSVPRYGFVDAVKKLSKDTSDKKANCFRGLKRQVDYCLQDSTPVFYESMA